MEPQLTADLERILRKVGKDDLINHLVEGISGSDLNSLLLKVFGEKTKTYSPQKLLKRYRENRFVQPAKVDALISKQLEMDVLNIAKKYSFSPIQLSPVAPLGCASVISTVDQYKVISALRGTEVVSDATNLLALHISDLIRANNNLRKDFIRFYTTHRHVRAPFPEYESANPNSAFFTRMDILNYANKLEENPTDYDLSAIENISNPLDTSYWDQAYADSRHGHYYKYAYSYLKLNRMAGRSSDNYRSFSRIL